MNEKADQTQAVIQELDQKIAAVRTTSLDISFNELADMHMSGELVIRPEFQRMFRWTEGAQSRFIESLLLELPVPPIFLIERADRIYELIDGLQRISSFLNFRGQLHSNEESLVLRDCDILESLNGYKYATLPKSLEIKLKRSYIRAEILRNESDARLRYYMFKRLNTGGELLSEQEVRNATIRLLSDNFNAFIIDLADDPNYQQCTGTVSDTARQRKFDQELVLRFFAFKNYRDNYVHDVADFLTEYMERVSDPDDEIIFDYNVERSIFEKSFLVLKLVSDHLGYESKIFGTMGNSTEPREQFSVYHYEGIALGLQEILDQVSTDRQEHIEWIAEVVDRGKRDSEFLNHCGAGKNYASKLRGRIRYFAERFSAVMERGS